MSGCCSWEFGLGSGSGGRAASRRDVPVPAPQRVHVGVEKVTWGGGAAAMMVMGREKSIAEGVEEGDRKKPNS